MTSIATSTGLIGVGVLAWAFAGRPLVNNPDLDSPLNPLGINGSPYGEVFAMAMQGPIDTHFHGVMGGGTSHQHADGGECDGCKSAKPASDSGNRFQNLLVSLEKAVTARTNPKSASQAHKLYLRRKVEDKLRFAYQLDPAHYANYNSLHFFLTEPQLGTRPELTPSAAKLAEDTIQYCLKQQNDPRPALTAAAATSNILELMFNDQQNPRPRFTTAQMRQYLNLLDHCINRYVAIAGQWDESKQWDLLSPQRIAECDDRLQFILKFREAAEGAIARFEGASHPAQVAN
jgi:hypothetical protein